MQGKMKQSLTELTNFGVQPRSFWAKASACDKNRAKNGVDRNNWIRALSSLKIVWAETARGCQVFMAKYGFCKFGYQRDDEVRRLVASSEET